MSEEKDIERLEVPDEMKELIREYFACMALRDKCIESVFKTRKAIYYAKRMRSVNRKFWSLAGDLHPSAKEGTDWYFNSEDECIYRKIKQLT